MKFCGMCGAALAQTCTRCGLLSPLGYHFCGHCGAEFVRAGERGSAGVPLLDRDGAEQEGSEPGLVQKEDSPARSSSPLLSGERRQATVLIADVKGSTRILEQVGSETWVEVMNEVLQMMGAAIYRFGGQVDQFRGDGLVAFFGARFAHEDDPERAVMAALSMQHELKSHAVHLAQTHHIDLLVRTGIHTGEVITASIGNGAPYREDTTMGGAVSLAARLEAAAEPGTILVSQATYGLVESRFKWKPLGEMTFRGLSQPVTVYRPLSPVYETEQQNRLQARGLWKPFIGREHPLKTIEEAVANLRAGVGSIILISGEAGMGKSRLIFEARQNVERDEALLGGKGGTLVWLQGRCRSYGQTLPDSMWVDLWHRWLGGGQWVSPEEASERLRKIVRTYAARGVESGADGGTERAGESDAAREERFEEVYPYLAAFLSLPLEAPYAAQVQHLDAEGLRHQFFITMRTWLEMMSRQNPLVLVFTEVHWADQTSLDLLKFCLPLCLQERILFVIVFRPERSTPAWNFKHFVETEYFHRLKSLALLPLTEGESNELIERMIGREVLSEQARAQILEKSNGNPYYLTELLHSLIDRGILVRDETGKWQTAGDEISLHLPDSLKSLLLARMDHLSSPERRVLQFAAVIGPIFWFNVLESLVKNGNDLRAQLGAMQRAQLITERGLLPDLGREYAFNATLIREAAYESILSSQRGELHLAVANYLEQIVQEKTLNQYHGIVAYHYRQAGNCQKDLFHTLLAAQEAQRIYANKEAILAYSHALDLMEGTNEEVCIPADGVRDEWKLEARQGLGQIQFGIGNVQEAEKHLREAIAIGRRIGLPASQLTRLFYWLGEVLFWRNSFEEPIRLGEEGLALLGDNYESTEAALMNQLVAIGCSQLGDHDKFIDFTLRTAGFIQRLPYSEELRPALDHIIALYSYTLKDLTEARRWLEVLKQKAEDHKDSRALGEYFEYSAVLHFQEGNLKAAIPKHRKAIEQFTFIGDSKHASRAWKSLGVSLLQQGALDEAMNSFEQALKNASVFANEADYAVSYWYKGQVLLCQGAWEAALAAFHKAWKIVEDVPYLSVEWALSGVGRVYLAQRMKENARTTFQTATPYLPRMLFHNPYQALEILSGLEKSFGEAEGFQNFVHQFQQEHPEIHRAVFRQWCLTPAKAPLPAPPPRYHETFHRTLAPGWIWQNPLGDCQYRLHKGLTIQAANERNLHHINRSAPRLLRQEQIRGDFTVQTIIQRGTRHQPAIGGLVVWLSEKYWFCLEVGGRGAEEIVLRGFLNNMDRVFGRGQLKGRGNGFRRNTLRLERRGRWLSAFCCADGEAWWYVGGCELSTIEPLRLGLHAIGHIHRLVYPGAYVEGTSVRFHEFWLWEE